MTAYELMDIYLSLTTKDDALWTIFFSVHIALFGGIIYVDRPLRRMEKTLAVFAYFIFALLNFFTLRNDQGIMESTVADLMVLQASPNGVNKTVDHIIEIYVTGQEQFMEPVTIGIHVLAGVLAIGAILFDRLREKK